MTSFTLTLGPYLCRFSAELSLERAWKDNNPVKVNQLLEDQLWSEYEDEIREAGEKYYVPELEGDYYSNIPEKYR